MKWGKCVCAAASNLTGAPPLLDQGNHIAYVPTLTWPHDRCVIIIFNSSATKRHDMWWVHSSSAGKMRHMWRVRCLRLPSHMRRKLYNLCSLLVMSSNYMHTFYIFWSKLLHKRTVWWEIISLQKAISPLVASVKMFEIYKFILIQILQWVTSVGGHNNYWGSTNPTYEILHPNICCFMGH